MFPDESLQPIVIMYTRPLPLPARSVRSCSEFPLMIQSGLVSPSPNPATGSLLATARNQLSLPPIVFTVDPTLTAGQTLIKAAHFTQLREATK